MAQLDPCERSYIAPEAVVACSHLSFSVLFLKNTHKSKAQTCLKMTASLRLIVLNMESF